MVPVNEDNYAYLLIEEATNVALAVDPAVPATYVFTVDSILRWFKLLLEEKERLIRDILKFNLSREFSCLNCHV